MSLEVIYYFSKLHTSIEILKIFTVQNFLLATTTVCISLCYATEPNRIMQLRLLWTVNSMTKLSDLESMCTVAR